MQIQKRALVHPANVRAIDKKSEFLKAHLLDGRVYVLTDWQVDPSGAAVTGRGTLLDRNRETLVSAPFTIPIDSVAIFETNVVQPAPAVAALTVITGASLAVTAYCLANPKACFGSCPTFYVPGPDGPLLQAEGFSASVAPALEAGDIDALYRARPTDSQLQIQMKNEALETHVVRFADLLVAYRPLGGRVLATRDGKFYEALELIAPAWCAGPEGDCLDEILDLDGTERGSVADSAYLGSRELLEMEFEAVPGAQLGLVIASRQSLMSTYLFYQGLAYLGRTSGDWFARLERGDRTARERAGGIGRILGNIEVQIQDGTDNWISAGGLGETGPLATNVHLIPLPDLPPGPQKIRLSLVKGYWRLDYLALAVLGGEVEPIRLKPATVFRDSARDVLAEQIMHDSTRVLVTLPGDVYTMTYELPENYAECELFINTRGYYLEWIREEWLAEQDPARAAMMFLNPEATLRLLAPEFKQVEAEMEDLFWNSRYAH